MSVAIFADKLTKRYRQRLAVDALDLEVREGEIFGFLGPNGAGKTTTIGMLLGLITPTSGRAEVMGYDVQRDPEAALQTVGSMVETPAFYPYLSGRDNLRALAKAAGFSIQHVEAALAAVRMSDRAKDRVRTYSLGMRQRLGIAAALLGEPRLLILDEPTNGLDPAGQQEIRTLVRELAGNRRTVFLCSHDLPEVEQLCQRVAILKLGKVIAQGTVAELLRRGRGLHVRVVGERDRALAMLHALEWVGEVRSNGEVFVLPHAPAERAAELNMLLSAQSIPIAEIRANEERLEDFFLEITQT